MIAIVGISLNGTIGKKGGLPWPRIQKDMEFFVSVTKEKKYCIVGHTTFDTLKPLKDRELLLVSRNHPKIGAPRTGQRGATYYDAIHPDAVKLMAHHPHVCIGGAATYELCLPFCSDLFVTLVKKEYDGDTKMPPFTHLFQVKQLIHTDGDIDIIHYQRKE